MDRSQVFAIMIRYGADTRGELGLLNCEMLRNGTVFTATKSLKGSKIAVLLSDIAQFSRGEHQWEEDGDVCTGGLSTHSYHTLP